MLVKAQQTQLGLSQNQERSSNLAEQLVRDGHKHEFLGRWFGRNNEPEHDEKIDIDVDASDVEFSGEENGWGGVTTRGREISDEEFPHEAGYFSDQDGSDDDDDHGGHMMPIPRLF